MTVKEHYDTHLGNFYSWMLGDFEDRKNEFLSFCKEQAVLPQDSKAAIDLGAGNGIQSVALAELGFKVKAVDFNTQLLAELGVRKKGLPIEIVNEDIKAVSRYKNSRPELIICCGDTISHLGSLAEIAQLLKDSFDTLIPKGKVVLSFRDYSNELKDTSRFIPVKNDSNRILTCFLEYLPDKVRVTDILYEREKEGWQQKISSYEKVRVNNSIIQNLIEEAGFNVVLNRTFNRMVTVIGQRNR